MRWSILVLLLTICAGCGRARLVDPVYRDASADVDAADGDDSDTR